MAASPSREKLRVGYLRDLKQDRCSIHVLMGSKLKYTERKISEQHKSIFQRINMAGICHKGPFKLGY